LLPVLLELVVVLSNWLLHLDGSFCKSGAAVTEAGSQTGLSAGAFAGLPQRCTSRIEADSRLLSTVFDLQTAASYSDLSLRPQQPTTLPPRVCLDPRFTMRPTQILLGGGGGAPIGKHDKSVSR
jgi:hypothetical protein